MLPALPQQRARVNVIILHVASKDQEWRTISFWLGKIIADHPSTLVAAKMEAR